MINSVQRSQKKIENALSLLLMTQTLTKITSSQIAKEAQISRASFYNYYKDKYDIIDCCQQRVFQKLELVFAQFTTNRHQNICQIFDILNQETLFSTLLLPNGSKEIHDFLRYKFQELVREDLEIQGSKFLDRFETHENHYCIVYLSSAYFTVCQTWISQGKKESPSQMADFLLKMIKPYHLSS
ncbi:TetR/AcrR family transcriptional regulator [Streptococcus sp. sy010]|uniref:TetR/AcrR family transcriptional regulator n=1 Tax=Streptococcus sp. sy010 TaxID=2600148 RepID=UPI0011B61AE0|nr:TetR/AcrR family transcriptional regulator [Streptococcus sp. sy010]TWT16728.1 TetR/AcrR family transcriptional regulator [Streptococcus sp. sy010]